MRLAKYLARAGIASRRRAEEMIREGRVCVNGKAVNVPQFNVENDDTITINGKPLQGPEPKIHVLLHKPPGYISTVRDTHNRPTVLDLVKDIDARLYPVGRLDADTSGALIMTNDGDLSHRLTHPSYGIKKKYLARISGVPSPRALETLRKGVLIDGAVTAPADVKVVSSSGEKNYADLELTIIEGKKRQIKKMCQAINHPVVKLHRTEFATLKCATLPTGKYRFLTGREIAELYRLVKLQ